MIQPWRQLRAQTLMLGHDLLRDIFERRQMRRRIAIPERMIGDENEAALQERVEVSEVGHAASMERRSAVGKARGFSIRSMPATHHRSAWP